MKRLILFILLLFAAVPVKAEPFKKPAGFIGKYWNGVLPLYEKNARGTHFVCTAEVIKKISGGYNLVSAGHCISATIPSTYFVADDVNGTLQPVTVLKFIDADMDFSLLEFKTSRKYPVLPLGSDENLRIGDPIVAIDITAGLGKQLAKGSIASGPLAETESCHSKCVGMFLGHLLGGNGASGAVVFSVRTHRVVGFIIGMWSSPIGLSIEPISRLRVFLQANIPLPVAVPADSFAMVFGPDHPFMLTVHGPDPQFTQSGITFKIDLQGSELSDFWYAAPVYVDRDEDTGVIALVSTIPPHYYVQLQIVAKANP